MAEAADGFAAELRRFAPLALPMVVSRIGVAAMGVVDGVMLARFSSEQLALHGLADALLGRALDVAMIFVTAGLALAAQALAGGAQAARAIGAVWHNALLLALFGGAAGLLLGAAATPVLAALGQAPALAEGAGRVAAILALGVAPALVALVCAGLLEAVGRPFGVALAVVVANGLNAALNGVLIFGAGPWPALGIDQPWPALGAAGAAWSTTLVRCALAVVLFAMLWWSAERAAHGLRGRFDRAAWQAGREQRARGAAGAANVAVLAGLSLAIPVMAGWLGTAALAQVTALALALAPMMVVAWGIGDAAGLRVAAVHGGDGGEHGPGRRRTGARLTLALALLLLGAAALYLAAPAPMLRWAAHEPALVQALLPLLPYGLIGLGADALAILQSAMLRSLGVLRGPFIVQAATGLALLPLAWALAFPLGLGVAGLLAAHAGLAVLRALALGWMFARHAAAHDGRAAAAPAPAAAPAAAAVVTGGANP